MDPAVVRKSCFIVAPYEVLLDEFLESLRRENIEPFFISDFLKSGSLAISNIRSAFRSVDLVVALLVQNRPIENAIFEIGMALGVGRPLLIFAESAVRVPSDLNGVRIHRTDLSDLQNVVPRIKEYLEPKPAVEASYLSERARAGSTGRHRSRLRGAELRNELQKVRNLWTHQNFVQAEAELSRLLSGIGWTVAEARESVRAQAPDLAVWIDEVQKDVGNPIAIELKATLQPEGLGRAVSQLTRYLGVAGAKAGVIIYGGPEQALDRNVAQNSPPIFAFSFDELAQLIEDDEFPDALKASLAAAKRAI